jgi:hypothetical protein
MDAIYICHIYIRSHGDYVHKHHTRTIHILWEDGEWMIVK